MSLTPITRAHAAALLFGGAALGIASDCAAQTSFTIRFAFTPTEGSAEVYYAKELGLFAKANLDADVQTMQTTSAIVAALTSNSIDIGSVTIDVLATIHQKGIPLVVIAPAAEYVSPLSTRTAALVVPANSPVQQAKDLNGKVIATPGLHTFGTTAPSVWIDRNGGDSSTVKFVEVPFPAMAAAIESGRVDAAFVTEPFLTIAKGRGRILAYPLDAISKHFLNSVWCVTPQWANANPGVVSRFARLMHDTAVWANANPQQSGEILAKYTKIDLAVIATMTRTHYGEQLTAALMQPVIDASAKYNGFSPFPAQDLVYAPAR